MTTVLNIANAIVIVACMYFGYKYEFNIWLILLIIFNLCLWQAYVRGDIDKEYTKSKTNFLNAKARYYDRKEK